MSNDVYVSIDGKVGKAIGPQPKDALLFVQSKKTTSQIINEQRVISRREIQLIKERFAEATKRP